MADNKNDEKALCNEADDVRKKSIRLLKRALLCLKNPDCKLCPLSDVEDCCLELNEDCISAYEVAIHDMEEQIENENENI